MLIFTYLALAFVCLHWGYCFGVKRTKKRYAVQYELAMQTQAATTVENFDVLPKPILSAAEKERKLKSFKKFLFTIGLIVAFFMSVFYIPEANAALSDAMRTSFHNEVANYVTGIMNDGSNDVNHWAKMSLFFFIFLSLFIELMYYILDRFSWERMLNAGFFIFLTLMFYNGYDYATQALWGIGEGISGGLQSYLVGNSDNFFLTQWIGKSTEAIFLKDLGFFDGFKAISILWTWTVVCFLLDLVAWIAALWADFGYAIAKVIGICFIPFLILPATRNFFDSWFKFFVGFIILNIMLKATLVMAAITLKAVLSDLGVKFTGSYGDPANVVSFGVDQFYLMTDGIAMLLVAILFVFSSFSFAASVAGGVGNLSGGLGKVTSMATRKLMSFI